MNNEPVAWFEQDPDMKSVWYQSDQDNPNAIPLYTHPVKKLSRELLDKAIIYQQNEIKDLRKNLEVALMSVNKPELTDEEIREVMTEFGVPPDYHRNFMNLFKKTIEEILKKAQEK